MVADRAGHRGSHRLRHLYGHRHRHGRAKVRCAAHPRHAAAPLPHPPHRHGRPSRRRTGAGAFAGAGGHRLRLYRPLLRRTGLHDSHRRLGLHLHLRHAGRVGCLDHRLGSDSGIRLQQHERQRGSLPPTLSICWTGSACILRCDGSRPPICPPACKTWRATISTSPAGTSASTFPPSWWSCS